MKVRRQLSGVSSFLPFCRSWGFNFRAEALVASRWLHPWATTSMTFLSPLLTPSEITSDSFHDYPVSINHFKVKIYPM